MPERHCSDARYVWNLAVEQFRYRERRQPGTTGRSAPGPAARQKQLAEARQERPVPKPDPDNPGQYLPNGAAAKAGLNKGIYANCWGMFARRLGQKMQASGTTLVEVPRKNSSIECRMCGHTAKANRKSHAGFQCVACGHAEHADIRAAKTVLARAGPAPVPGRGTASQGAGTARRVRESENQRWTA
jgi:transposase